MCNMLHFQTLSFIDLCSPPMSSVTGRRSHDHCMRTIVQSFVFFWHHLLAVSAALPFKITAPTFSFSADSWINIIVGRITIHVFSKLNIIKKISSFFFTVYTVNILFETSTSIQNPDLLYKHTFWLIPLAQIPQDWIQVFFWFRVRPLGPEKNKQKMSNKSNQIMAVWII